MSAPVPDKIKTSVRESDKELLLGLAEGLPFSVISQQTDLTEMQVANRIFWLRAKIFRVRTNAQLIAMSYHYGILRSPNE